MKGVEIKINPCSKDSFEILALFLSEGIKSNELFEILDEIKSQDGIIALPHPFDPFKGNPKEIRKILERVDAVEVFNSRVPASVYNRKALSFAKKHGLGMIGGSDAHTEREVGNAYTVANVNDLEGLRKAIIKRETGVEGKLTSHLSRVAPSIGRFFGKGSLDKKFKSFCQKIVEKTWSSKRR